MNYIVVASGKPFAVDEIVLRFSIENDCSIDSYFAIYSDSEA